MLIDGALLYAFNGIQSGNEELLAVHIGTACQIINDYVGFDSDEVTAEGSAFTAPQQALFRSVALRIATLLQMEGGANLGVASSEAVGVGRQFLNVVDYTPYLKPLSAFRRNTDM